jgi:hypothetical protein
MPEIRSHSRHPRRRSLLRHGIAAAGLVLAWQAVPAAAATSILFIGNSFTYGALASVQTWNTGSVTDLVPGSSIGGVPALFKAFTVQAGLDYDVSLETQPGSNLSYHYNTAARRALIDRPWDKVVMHGQSNLDFSAPNNPASISQYTGLLGTMFRAQNPNVDISLTATWSRADLTYLASSNPGLATSPWKGAPIEKMGEDVHAGYEVAKAQNAALVSRVNPVGLAWNRAFADGVADNNPYDGIDPGKVNLWASDHYHASNAGYYLHALVVFGMVTGVNPTTLGAGEMAAASLGIAAADAVALQGVAAATIAAVPEPSTWLMLAMGGGVLAWAGRRRRATANTA